jgi:hypothetical protein
MVAIAKASAASAALVAFATSTIRIDNSTKSLIFPCNSLGSLSSIASPSCPSRELWGYLAANNLALDNVEAGKPCPASNGEQPIAECGVVFIAN